MSPLSEEGSLTDGIFPHYEHKTWVMVAHAIEEKYGDFFI
jgi:hypothetical protein